MQSSRWTAADIPELSGQTAVITGASSGLGAETARALAQAGAHVVMAVRDRSKGQRVADAIAGDVEVRALDLADLASVRAFAAAWSGPIEVLVNNAGIMAVPETRTADGFEAQIGVNHLGHFALTALLLPHITGRIVTVSSELSNLGHIDLDDLNWQRRRYRPWRAYGQSKLANLLFTYELQRRLAADSSEVRAVAAHPGVAGTGLQSTGSRVRDITLRPLRLLAQDAAHGALPTLFAATRDIPGGAYVGPDGRMGTRRSPRLLDLPASGSDPEVARDLWARSAELTHTSEPPAPNPKDSTT